MVRGSYTPPIQVSTGSIQGTDSDGNTGLTVSDGEVGLRADGVQVLTGTPDGITMKIPVVTVTASDSPFSVQIDDLVIFADTSSGPVEISLPSAVTAANRQYIIKDKGSARTNNVTVSAAVGNVDGFASVSIVNSYAFFSLVSDGSNYWVVD